MFKEQSPIFEPQKEKKPIEMQRFELDPEKGMDIVIKEKEGGEKILFKRDKGKRYDHFPAQVLIEKEGEVIEDLSKWAQDGIYFCRNKEIKGGNRWKFLEETFSVSPSLGLEFKKRAVTIPRPSEWQDSKDVIRIIHELGHSIRQNKNPKANIQEDFITAAQELKNRGDTSEAEAKNLLKKMIETIAEEERGAWAEGLQLARELKRNKGIDLLKPIRGKKGKIRWKEFDNIIDQSLSSYETFYRGFIAAGLVSEDIKGTFVKNYKENIRNKMKIFLFKTLLNVQKSKKE